MLEPKAGPLEEQNGLLAAEPGLQSPILSVSESWKLILGTIK